MRGGLGVGHWGRDFPEPDGLDGVREPAGIGERETRQPDRTFAKQNSNIHQTQNPDFPTYLLRV
eukprot:2966291-Rhodomonas_salina.2